MIPVVYRELTASDGRHFQFLNPLLPQSREYWWQLRMAVSMKPVFAAALAFGLIHGGGVLAQQASSSDGRIETVAQTDTTCATIRPDGSVEYLTCDEQAKTTSVCAEVLPSGKISYRECQASELVSQQLRHEPKIATPPAEQQAQQPTSSLWAMAPHTAQLHDDKTPPA